MRDSLDARTGLVVAGGVLLVLGLLLDRCVPGTTAWAASVVADVLVLAGALTGIRGALHRDATGLRRALPPIGGAVLLRGEA